MASQGGGSNSGAWLPLDLSPSVIDAVGAAALEFSTDNVETQMVEEESGRHLEVSPNENQEQREVALPEEVLRELTEAWDGVTEQPVPIMDTLAMERQRLREEAEALKVMEEALRVEREEFEQAEVQYNKLASLVDKAHDDQTLKAERRACDFRGFEKRLEDRRKMSCLRNGSVKRESGRIWLGNDANWKKSGSSCSKTDNSQNRNGLCW